MGRPIKFSGYKTKTMLRSQLLLTIGCLWLTGFSGAGQNRGTLQILGAHSLPAFEVASIKRANTGNGGSLRILPGGRLIANGVTAKFLLTTAYDIKGVQLLGGPSWLDSDSYDIDAKPDDTLAADLDKLSPDMRKQTFMRMVQSLLLNRFHLVPRPDTKELSVYTLTVAKGGPKLNDLSITSSSQASRLSPKNSPLPDSIWMPRSGTIISTGVNISQLAAVLSRATGRIVIDETGLRGKYHYTLKWSPNDAHAPLQDETSATGSDLAPSTDLAEPTLFSAIQQQLGLLLKPTRAAVDILVIEHIERPSGN